MDRLTCISRGGADLFVAGFDASMTPRWLTSAGGSGTEEGAEIDVALDGAIRLHGSFSATATVGSFILTAAGARDSLQAAYDVDGSCRWARAGGGTGDDIAYALAASDDGRLIAIAGHIGGPATFGPITFGHAGGADGFVVLHAADGALPTRRISVQAVDAQEVPAQVELQIEPAATQTGVLPGGAWFDGLDARRAASISFSPTPGGAG